MRAILELGAVSNGAGNYDDIEDSRGPSDRAREVAAPRASFLSPEKIRHAVEVWENPAFYKKIKEGATRTEKLSVIGRVARENKGVYVAGMVFKLLAEGGKGAVGNAARLLEEYGRENPAQAGEILASLEASTAPHRMGLDFSSLSSAVDSIKQIVSTGTELYGAYKQIKETDSAPKLTTDVLSSLISGGGIGGALASVGITNIGGRLTWQDPQAQTQVSTALTAAGTTPTEVRDALMGGAPTWVWVAGAGALLAATVALVAAAR